MAMKQSEILGLFTSPQDISKSIADRIVAQSQQFYSDPIAQQLYRGAGQLTGGIAQQAGMQLQGQAEAEQIKQIRESVPFDVNNQSEYYTKLAQRLINQGLTQAGAQALELAKKARLDEAKIIREEAKTKGDLSVTAEKEINKSNQAYSDAIANFSKASELSAKFMDRQDDLLSGIAALAGETWKDIIGGQDEVTELRKEALGLFNSQALKSLPPGAASDTDVALVLRPFPSENASPTYIARFLAGQAKGQLLEAEFNKFRASYLSQNRGDAGGLIPAWQEYYKGIDLEQLFAQYGFRYNPSTEATGAQTPSAGEAQWSAGGTVQ